MKSILFFLFLIVSSNCKSQTEVENNYRSRIYTDTINSENIRRITKDLSEFIIIKNFNEQIRHVEVIDTKEKNVDFEDYKIIDSYSEVYQEFTKYLIYKTNNKIFVKKYDNHGEYNDIEIKNNAIFPFLKKNIRKIKKEKIKNYLVKTVSVDNKITYAYQIAPAPIYTEIYLRVKKLNSTTKYHFYDMKNENNENINYAENMKLKVIILETMCKAEIEKLEKNKSFVKN